MPRPCCSAVFSAWPHQPAQADTNLPMNQGSRANGGLLGTAFPSPLPPPNAAQKASEVTLAFGACSASSEMAILRDKSFQHLFQCECKCCCWDYLVSNDMTFNILHFSSTSYVNLQFFNSSETVASCWNCVFQPSKGYWACDFLLIKKILFPCSC